MICILATCLALLAQEPMPTNRLMKKFNSCARLLQQAETQGLRPIVVGSLAYHESRFSHRVVSKAGAKGILQVIPRYWCPARGKCNYVQAGFKAWKTYLKRGTDLRDSLCLYSTGRHCKKTKGGRRYAAQILKTLAAITNTLGVFTCYSTTEQRKALPESL
jgi:hypothetical protein